MRINPGELPEHPEPDYTSEAWSIEDRRAFTKFMAKVILIPAVISAAALYTIEQTGADKWLNGIGPQPAHVDHHPHK